MESLFAEQPALVSLMLAAVAVALIYGWLQTGKRATAIAAAIFLALIPVAWIVAAQWQTDREVIEQLIYEIADAVEANDHQRAVAVIGDRQTRSRAQMELQQWEFHVAAVNSIRSIDVISETIPKEADVDMTVKVEVSKRNSSFRNIRVPRRLILRMEERGNRWVVTDYQHMPLVGGPDRYSQP